MKKAMKLLSVLLCVALLFTTFAACSNNVETETTAAEGETTTAADTTAAELVTKEIEAGKVYNIGICQLTQHPALDAATEGFQKRLTELMGEDHVKFDLQNAAGETDKCSTIVNQFVASKVDLIMANATPALQAAVNATADIPIVGTSVTDYATALNISTDEWAGKTGMNVTGTSDLAPLDKQAAMFAELLPEAKTIGILYCSGEANSKYQATEIAKYLADQGVTTKEYTFSDTNDIQSVATKAVDECDAIYIPTDNKAADCTEVINNVAEPAGIPIIAGEEGICKGCGLATLSISYYDLGVATAEVTYDILVNGADPAETEIKYAPAVTKEYVKDRADALKITIPNDYEAISTEE
ncbi:MAG: ABC transporter substrate-binding protein [Acutalibacteraceae bacterium]